MGVRISRQQKKTLACSQHTRVCNYTTVVERVALLLHLHCGGDDDEPLHVSPAVRHVLDERVAQEPGGQDPEVDHELVDRAHGPSVLRGGDLGEEDGHNAGTTATHRRHARV